MNRTFEMTDFESAIRDKDYIKLKNYIINSIRNNPRFSHSKSEEYSEAAVAFKRLEEMKTELPGLFSPYELQEGEEEFDENNKASWNQEYFIRQTFLLGENFCRKRFINIRKIGQYITKGNFNDPQEVLDGYENSNIPNSSTPEDAPVSAEKKPWATIVLVLVSIVVFLVGIMAEIKGLLIIGGILMAIAVAIAIMHIYKR